MSREQLTNDIWRACDILRRDDNCGGVMEYVEHLSWLLFLKFFDEQEAIFEVEAELAGRTYKRVIDEPYRWSSWIPKALGQKIGENGRRSTPEWDGEKLMQFVRGELISYLASLYGSSEREVIAGIFSDRTVIVCASPYNLKDVLEIVDSIDFKNADDIHTVSHIYEDLLKRLGSENKMAGEFYTPRSIIRFMVEVIDPQIGETVYDPFCGSCGFLVEAYLHMQKQEKTTKDHKILQYDTFVGQEKKALPALLGTMNMVLHGVRVPDIRRRNTLAENLKNVSERFDIVLTNPPFGGKENAQIQENFPVKSNATELLAVEHIIKKLKLSSKARCGMVVPAGTLFRSGAFATVKQMLLNDFSLFLVVSLPPGAFAPYSDVKTALLFFERSRATKEVLYYEMPLPEKLKKFSKNNPITDEHFAETRQVFQKLLAYRLAKVTQEEFTNNSWFVDRENLVEREYDLSARNPHRLEIENLPHPSELTARILENQKKLHEKIERLHKLVSGQEEA
ncbi:restriction endonuclease subunit M [Nostoc sp. CENA543]|uniref:type I restriction-modification system subunit M n=1 Tax=Nostoc sp. CENA543 TaxID=1869241 RepID=UPI000CA206D0|nr:type I restriction-modification system subunit M [Nostoc sp. CENA543]AUT02872.1 restriction endonuclease subunit M [Nostoc sp. CENA543]